MKKLSALSMLLAIVIPCSASTITINWNGTGDYTTIQAGINAAVSGVDTVIVAQGTYTENIGFGDKNIVLTSTDPNDPVVVAGTVIDGGGSFSPTVQFSGAENNSCLLTGFTITGGSAIEGSGIDGNGTEASIIKCVITGNRPAGVGGGAYGCYGVIKDCIISGNEALYGGGLAYCDGTISNCIITNNYAGFEGGGLWECSADITNSLITNNVAELEGGGASTCSATMTNCTICDNRVAQGVMGGGGLAQHGGGDITNCIFWGNTDSLGSVDEEAQLKTSATVNYSCIQGCSTYYSFGTGNIGNDPNFASDNDYHLTADSACVDAGTNSPPPGLPSEDLDGQFRPIDGDNDGQAVADMGCYELGPDPVILLSAGQFQFTAMEDDANPPDQILTISNIAGGTLNWEITYSDCDWLDVTPLAGSCTGEPNDVTLSVDITALGWGEYNCQLTVSDPCAMNSPKYVNVSLDINHLIYVDASASTGGNGQTWGTAYKYLQDAFKELPSDGDEIWVAEGIYHPDDDDAHHPGGTGLRTDTFGLISGVLVYGGFPPGGGTWQERDPNRYESVLSGDLNDDDDEVSEPYDLLSESTRIENSYHVVTGSGTDPDTILDGFTISDGNAETNGEWRKGGGMYNYSGSPTVTNCTFSNNSADEKGAGVYNNEYSGPAIVSCTFVGNAAPNGGGGVGNEYSDPTLVDCIFINNVVSGEMSGGGGGMYNYESSPTVTGCTFTHNSTNEGSGGGMYNYSYSSPTVTGCTFTRNSTYYGGGGMHNYDYSSPTVTGCIFSGNTAVGYGGGMRNEMNVNSVLTNCTFSANSAGESGGGIFNGYSDLTLTNCIVWGNTATSGPQLDGDGTSSETVNYSDVQGGWPGTGNIDEDPLFKDPNGPDRIAGTEDDNLQPGYGSPCIDAGDSNSVPADIADLDDDGDTTERTPLDLAGRERFTDDPKVSDTGTGTPPIVDMGAYERYEFCGDAEHPYPTMDMNDDCAVNFEDVRILALAWLSEDGEAAWNPDCDINIPADGLINLLDLGVLEQHWQESARPE